MRAGDLLVGDHAQDVAGRGHLAEAEQHHGRRRAGLGDALAERVLHGPDAAVGLAHDHDVADAQRAGLDQDGRDRAAALVQLRLDDGADGLSLGVRPWGRPARPR